MIARSRSLCLRLAVLVAAAVMSACSAGTDTPTAPPIAAAKSPATDPALDNRVLQWSDIAVEAIRVARPAPTVAARSLAVVHSAIYDAWAPYDARAVGTQVTGPTRRPLAERTAANKEKAISYAAYRALVDLWPAQAATFRARMIDMGYDPTDATQDVSTAAGVGNRAAAAVLAFRSADGANQAGGYADYTGYAPVNGPDLLVDESRWQPLRLPNGTVQRFATPQWSRVVPFALTSASQFRPAAPLPWTAKSNRKQIDEIIKISQQLSDESKAISEYWSDGPGSELPPGHWCVLAKSVSKRDAHDLDADAKMFFTLANALLDASIVAWDAKREFDSARPITAIRSMLRGERIKSWGGPGKGTLWMTGDQWVPYQRADFVTPPFPEFVSGHSTFSAAAAAVLEGFTGSDRFEASATVRAGSSLVEPGLTPRRDVTLSWKRFQDAVDEAGHSRLLGGIHFAEGNERGKEMGRRVGALVWAKSRSYFDGTVVR